MTIFVLPRLINNSMRKKIKSLNTQFKPNCDKCKWLIDHKDPYLNECAKFKYEDSVNEFAYVCRHYENLCGTLGVYYHSKEEEDIKLKYRINDIPHSPKF